MNYCPYCMKKVNTRICPDCRKDISWEPKPSQLPPGTVLKSSLTGRTYLLGAVIGQGGFGITYVALDLENDAKVAVKECFPSQIALRKADHLTVESKQGNEAINDKMRLRFLQEGQMLKKQTAVASVVRVFDSFKANNTAYLVMEYLEGETLQQKMKREGKIPAAQLMPALKPLMMDLGKIHSSGIVHRDIAPDNIMRQPDGKLVLMDFGSARTMDANREMSVLLKHEFAPVEQYQKKGQGPWTDVYALSATIYYCLTGVVAPQAVERLENDKIISPRALGAELTENQESALMWGLTVQPSLRPQDMYVYFDRMFPEEERKYQQQSPVQPQPAQQQPPVQPQPMPQQSPMQPPPVQQSPQVQPQMPPPPAQQPPPVQPQPAQQPVYDSGPYPSQIFANNYPDSAPPSQEVPAQGSYVQLPGGEYVMNPTGSYLPPEAYYNPPPAQDMPGQTPPCGEGYNARPGRPPAGKNPENRTTVLWIAVGALILAFAILLIILIVSLF